MATAQKTVVQEELCGFLQQHHLEHSVENIDDVVLEYVITILEELGDEENAEENIDVDQFIEMVDAYVPGFAEINNIKVFEWMFQLASKLSKKDTADSIEGKITPGGRVRQTSLSDEFIEALTSTTTDERNGNCQKETKHEEEDDEQVKLLLEMFPKACTMEITHCLGLANGDSEVAVQLILDRQESGECIKPKKEASQKKKCVLLDDKNLKDQMIARYSYIDADEHKKSYTPVAPKQNPKKLVRYLENRIVSTKGEKFTEIKKEDSEEMKKTYVNLKPARKYRFH